MIQVLTVWLLVSLPYDFHTPTVTVATFATKQECERLRQQILDTKASYMGNQLPLLKCFDATIAKP